MNKCSAGFFCVLRTWWKRIDIDVALCCVKLINLLPRIIRNVRNKMRNSKTHWRWCFFSVRLLCSLLKIEMYTVIIHMYRCCMCVWNTNLIRKTKCRPWKRVVTNFTHYVHTTMFNKSYTYKSYIIKLGGSFSLFSILFDFRIAQNSSIIAIFNSFAMGKLSIFTKNFKSFRFETGKQIIQSYHFFSLAFVFVCNARSFCSNTTRYYFFFCRLKAQTSKQQIFSVVFSDNFFF